MKPSHSIQLIGIVILSASLTQNLGAQRIGSVALRVNAERDSSPLQQAGKLSYQVVGDTTPSRAARTSRDALIGAGIGAATGLVTAFIATHNASVTDHSEDGLAYIGFTAFGALVGLVVGGIVGFIRN
jgi:ABC-type nitrate/sulfonate/bicarbonate transport system permease component